MRLIVLFPDGQLRAIPLGQCLHFGRQLLGDRAEQLRQLAQIGLELRQHAQDLPSCLHGAWQPFQLHLRRLRLLLRIKRLQNEAHGVHVVDLEANARHIPEHAQQLGGKRVNIGAVERRGHEHGVRKTAAGLLIRSRQLFKKIAQPCLMRVERLRDGCGDTIQLLRQLQALILLLEQVAAEFSVYTLIVSCICYSIYIRV